MTTLSMSSMTALKVIIEFESESSTDSIDKLEHIKAHHPSISHFDWSGADSWNKMIVSDVRTTDLISICRHACSHFILRNQFFLELVSQGRESFVATLNDDERQVFRNGGLLEKIPSREVVSWWDEIRYRGRSKLNHDLLEQGRTAERWTIEYEMDKVAHLGDNFKPVWMALDSDRHGYDILSYRASAGFAPIAVLIEVKSFANRFSPHFFLTRNEWEKAIESHMNYVFYVWCIETKEHRIYKYDEIEPHIPSNRGLGKWQNVHIPLQSW